MADTIQPSPWQPGEINGMKVARRVIFRAPVKHDYWPGQMLNAIATAKALGVTMFEIDAPGQQEFGEHLEQTRENNVQSVSFYSAVAAEQWKQERPDKSRDKYITVYAVVVE